MHITSLPGPYGNGDLGPEAHRFIEFLASAGQRWWQTLPAVAPPVPGFSPYSAQSAFAGSPWLVSLELLQRDGLLAALKPFSGTGSSHANLAEAAQQRDTALRQAYEEFKRRSHLHNELNDFCKHESGWLDDWSLFAALKSQNKNSPWVEWDGPIRMRQPSAVQSARETLADEINFHRFVQFQFDRQWKELRQKAAQHGIGFIGDVPIFVAADSCDVWANRNLFTLDDTGRPTRISGCPPDMFSADGQFWNHPQYHWPAHQEINFAWWVSRFQTELRRFDGVRIDHFLGFNRTWSIPAAARTAREGEWMPTPGQALFDAVHKAVGTAPIIAEDLGVLTEEAAKLRDHNHFPGMRVLQFGFDDSYYLPHRFIKDCVAYTGTHDNNTLVGWFSELKPDQQAKALAYLNCTKGELTDAAIRALMASVANTIIVPIQDVLGLGAADRMNIPGHADNNWRWRLQPNQLTAKAAARLRELTTIYDRSPTA